MHTVPEYVNVHRGKVPPYDINLRDVCFPTCPTARVRRRGLLAMVSVID